MTSSRIPPCGRPAHRGSKLTAENILSEAGKLLQEQGKVPSIRALAAQLQVDPMAIYYYFRNKQALLEALATALVDDIYQPSAQAPVQQELQRLAESYLHLLADALHGHTVAIRRTDYTFEQSRALFQPVLALITELIERPGASLS
ncbi:TetR/AcrR family transcriptional regulator [Morganella morganii]